MKRLLLLLITASFGSAAPARQTVPPPLPSGFVAPAGSGDSLYPLLGDAGLNVTHYDLSLRATPGVDAISGRAVLSITAATDLTQINLDFAGPRIVGVKVDGQAVRHAQVGEKLLILPPQSLAAGTTFTVTVAYLGTPALHLDTSDPGDSGGLRLGWITQAGGSYVLSEPDGSHTFFPCNDVPADGASYTLHLDVPAGTTAIASGVQTRQVIRGGRSLSDFDLRAEVPTYALTVHIGHLQVVSQPGPDGVTIRNAYPAGLPDSVKAGFSQTPAMLSLLSRWYGPYPYPVYGVAVTEDPQIPALETATLSTFPSQAQGQLTAVHELAHQWFGDSLRLGDWSDIWLNEGFATYAELLWTESQGGNPSDTVQRWYDRLRSGSPRGLVATKRTELFDNTSYLRGALALQALRKAVGDDLFRTILTTYVDRFTGKSVRTTDLLTIVGEVSGQRGLNAILPWTEGPAIPPIP